MDNSTAATSDSFEKRVGSKIKPQPNGCWYFGGRGDRYGKVGTTVEGKTFLDLAHRVVYEVLVGPIPDGLYLHHECEQKGCVNPAHLTPMTPTDHTTLHAAMRAAA